MDETAMKEPQIQAEEEVTPEHRAAIAADAHKTNMLLEHARAEFFPKQVALRNLVALITARGDATGLGQKLEEAIDDAVQEGAKQQPLEKGLVDRAKALLATEQRREAATKKTGGKKSRKHRKMRKSRKSKKHRKMRKSRKSKKSRKSRKNRY